MAGDKHVIQFLLNDNLICIDFSMDNIHTPTTTILQYLRSLPNTKGTKEGCAEGDCGACTVVIVQLNEENKLEYKAYDSCLIFFPMLHGKQLITVEYLKSDNELHPVQQAMIDTDGSQCGYCTPGFVMSLFALYKAAVSPTKEEVNDALSGNLCRCTGYRPILDAAFKACSSNIQSYLTKKDEWVIEQLKRIKVNKDTVFIECSQQKYSKAFSLSELLKLKFSYPSAIIVNGATDVALRVTKKHEHLSEIIDISDIDDLKKITEHESHFEIGAGSNLETLRNKSRELFPALYKMLCVFGSRQIRNKGSLGGNIANASPIGDMPPVLMAYQASVVLNSIYGKRMMKLSEFITGYRSTQLKPFEIISSILIPKTDSTSIIQSYKISKRKDLDISTVSAAFTLSLSEDNIVKDIQMYYGGMAATTKEPLQAKNFLIGKKWDRKIIEEAMQLMDLDFTPISDARSGAEGRKIMARNLLLKFWSETKT